MPFEHPVDSEFVLPITNFVQNSSVLFYQCSLDKNYPVVQISPNVKEIMGYAPRDFYKDDIFWLNKIHTADRPAVKAAFFNIEEQGKCTYVYRFRHKAGHYIWLRDENMINYDSAGIPAAITGTAINITKQKEAEQEVKQLNHTLEKRIDERTTNLSTANRKLKKQIQSRNKAEKQVTEQQKQLKLLQAGINHINDMVIISKAPIDDPFQSQIVFTNNAFENFTGYTSAEVIGKRPTFLHGKKTDAIKMRDLNNKIKSNEPARVEFINYKKDGTPYWVELELTPFPAEKGMQYWVGINRDISMRKKAEQALEENEERYRTYTELSFDAIFELSLDGTIIDCNARACQLFGYQKEELLGMNTKALTPAEFKNDFPQEITPDSTTGSKVLQREYRKKDGSIFTTEISTKLYHQSEADHIIAYVRDISEHIAHEKMIEKSLREKSTLLAEVHHRVKNNLAVISGLLEMQAFNAEDELVVSELKESQSRIQSIATVHELLYQSESFSNIELGPYIDELVSYISGTMGSENTEIKINKEIEPISLTVKQAVPCGLLLNELITNVYKHAFKGMSEGMISIKLDQKEETVSLHVCDDGVGLPENIDVDNSSSLGLTLIHTLVQQLEGRFSVARKPATCFKIKFKIQD